MFGSRVGGTRTRGFDAEDGDSSSFAASQGSYTNTRTQSSVDSGCSEGAPLEKQIAECKEFIERSEKSVAAETVLLEDAR